MTSYSIEGIKTVEIVTIPMKNLVVMLPTLDEEYGLREILPLIPKAKLVKMGWNTEIWVIDGGSKDLSVEIAEQYECEIIRQAGYGKGAAMRTGFNKFIARNKDALVMLDADGTYDPAEIANFVKHLDSSDVVIGDRLHGTIEPGAMTRMNYFGNHMLTWIASALYGTSSNDLCTGYWGFTKSAIARLKLNSMRFEIEAEMFASMVHQRVPFGFVRITYGPRLGEAKLGSTADGWRILRKLITRRIFPVPLL